MCRRIIFTLIGVVLATGLVSAQTVIPGGPVSGTWDLAGSPYLVEGEITVPAGQTLNIDPGVEVTFQGHYKFIVNGFLDAIGTETNAILFTAADALTGWHGIRFINAPDGSQLSYCILEYGRATGSDPDYNGGGIFCSLSNPVISNCTIRECSATGSGGGIACWSSSPQILGCAIMNNSSYQSDGGGGGIACLYSGTPLISNCTIEGNMAAFIAGGIGLMYTDATIEFCDISGNTAYDGGGFYFTACVPLIDRCTITDNSVTLDGGGMEIVMASPLITNCTVSRNLSLRYGSQISIWEGATAEIISTIVEGGTTNHLIHYENSPDATFYYCDINNSVGLNFWGGIPPGLGTLVDVNANGDSCDVFMNIFEDPEFVYPIQNDYRLSWGSACIDAGDPASPLDPDGTCCDMGAFCYDQSIPVRILLTPFDTPIEIPATGGSFDYYIQVTNIDPSTLNVDAWCDATLPSGGIYGPTLGPVNIAVPGEFTIGRERNQSVPAGAPAGMYAYNAYAVAGPDTSFDSFTFVKLGSDGMDGMAGWFNTGESFEELMSELDNPLVPEIYSLEQNFPNPFNPATTISFALPTEGKVTLTVYDVNGRLVSTLVDGYRNAGVHEVTFDGSNLASGIYLYRLEAGQFTASGKMVLMK